MANFTKLAEMALRLIAKNGRTVKLVRSSKTPKDPEKPWKGSDCANIEISVKAAVVESKEMMIGTTLVRNGQHVAWVGAVAGEDLSEYDFVKDGGKKISIEDVEIIKPADVVVAYAMVLER